MEQLKKLQRICSRLEQYAEAVQTLVMENIELRQAMTLRDSELKMAEALMEEVANRLRSNVIRNHLNPSVVFGRDRSEQKDFPATHHGQLNFRASRSQPDPLTCRPRI